jgi:hypothetical protein
MESGVYGIGAMVRACVGEWMGAFRDYHYFFSEGEFWSVTGSVECSQSYKYGGAQAVISGFTKLDGTEVTAGEALDGLYEKATSKECLDTLPAATDFSVELYGDQGPDDERVTCSDRQADIVCDGGSLAFQPEVVCKTQDCSQLECCSRISESPAFAPSHVLTLGLSVVSLLVALL